MKHKYIPEYHQYQVKTNWHGPLETYIQWRNRVALKAMQRIELSPEN